MSNVKIKFNHPGEKDENGEFHYWGSICAILVDDVLVADNIAKLFHADRFSRPLGQAISFYRAFKTIPDRETRLAVAKVANPRWLKMGREYVNGSKSHS